MSNNGYCGHKSWFLENSWRGQIGHATFKNLYLLIHILVNSKTLRCESRHSIVSSISRITQFRVPKRKFWVFKTDV